MIAETTVFAFSNHFSRHRKKLAFAQKAVADSPQAAASRPETPFGDSYSTAFHRKLIVIDKGFKRGYV
ncbi:MAG TPA: hypothetical protein VF604_01065 [Pyrinomonadaceae bacterium]